MSKCTMEQYTAKEIIDLASSHANALGQKIEFNYL